MPRTLEEIKKVAIAGCIQFDVGRLDAFGSTVRGNSKELSDVDLLVEFKDPGRYLSKRFFGLLHYLEDRLGCRVDLITMGSLKNPYFREHVLEERVPIYEG